MISLSTYLVNLGMPIQPAINHGAISLAESNISQRIDRPPCSTIKSMAQVSPGTNGSCNMHFHPILTKSCMSLKLFGNKTNDLCIRRNPHASLSREPNRCLNHLEHSDFIRVSCDFNGCLQQIFLKRNGIDF